MNAFWTAFFLIFFAELADKSRVVGLLLSTRFSSPVAVFFGMTLGYALLDGLGVYFGGAITRVLPRVWISAGVGILFVVTGGASLLFAEKTEAKVSTWLERVNHWGPFFVSLAAISISEMGDRTQIAAGALSAETNKPWLVFSGTLAALALLNLLTVWAGKTIAQKIPAQKIQKGAGLLFLVVGLVVLFNTFFLKV